MLLPSIREEGIYNYESMDVPNLISIIENSDLDKFVVFNITYNLLGDGLDRFSLEVQKEKVAEFDCDVISYKLDLDGTTAIIFYLVGSEIKFLFVSEVFSNMSKNFEEEFLKYLNKFSCDY